MSLGMKNGKNGAGHRQLTDDLFPLETAVSPSTPLPAKPLHELPPACPHFGSADDPATRFLFASLSGTCYRAQPADQVSLTHQQAFCLAAQHHTCPVFQRVEVGPLPAELRTESANQGSWRRARTWGWAVLVVGVLVTAVLLLASRFPDFALATPVPLAAMGGAPTATAVTAMSTDSPAVLPLLLETETAVPTPSPFPTATLPPTATPSPSATPKPTLPATFTPAATASATLPPTAVPLAVVNVPTLNVRQGPSTDYPIIGEIIQSGQYEVIGQSSDGGWWQLCCIVGEPGWVIGEAVTVEGDTVNVPIVRVPPAEENN
jgi:hypothetical protein